MQQTYNLKWLTNKFDTGEYLEFLFFWGHSNKPGDEIGKFCFSQWFELPFKVDGILYKTAEHWMMANKALLFADSASFKKIIATNSPAEAKKLGRLIMGFDEVIWDKNRMQIVIDGNIHKFNQHPRYMEYLLNTKNRILVEASPIDKIWGIGLAQDSENIDNPYFWNGENLLGFALMEVRAFFEHFGQFQYIEPEVPLPWKAYPKIDSRDMFWRMGTGETLIMRFSDYYRALSDRDKEIIALSNPSPNNWEHFW